MGLLILGLGLTAIGIIIFAIVSYDETKLFLVLAPIIMFITVLFGFLNSDSPATFSADVTGISDNHQTTIYFDAFSQSSNIVTINAYYVTTMHWTDFDRYTKVDKTLEIQIPDGKSFQYKTLKEPVQTAIEQK